MLRPRLLGLVLISALGLAACADDGGPTELPPLTSSASTGTTASPSVDPTAAAEQAAIEAIERYYAVLQQAGVSGEWDEESLSEGARGEALRGLVALGEGYVGPDVGEEFEWVFQGEIRVTDPMIDSLTLDPGEAVVTACQDDTKWTVVGDPDDYVNDGPNLVSYRVTRNSDGQWYVTEWAGSDEESAPC